MQTHQIAGIPADQGADQAKRRFKIQLAIYLGVNAVLIAIWVGLLLAGARFGGSPVLNIVIYVLLMGAWGVRVLFEGIRAYRS